MKRLVYLISPNRIYKSFYKDLKKVLEYNNVKFFQLRIKKTSNDNLIRIAKKIAKITKKYNVKLIINDNAKVAKKIKADGCHLGQSDESIIEVNKYFKNKIIGVTCHNSKKLAQIAIKNKAKYVAFGSFYNSKLKPKAIKADLKVLKWAKINIQMPIVAIGGITDKNYKKIINSGANYIAISSFIWDNPDLKPQTAIKKFE